MNYFEAIRTRCEELDKLGQAYLDKFEFLPNDQVLDRIWNKAQALFEAAGEDFDKLPEWAAEAMDGHIPYSSPPRNGSLYCSMGWSVVAQDAHLRNQLEIAEGRETKELDFPVLAEKEIVLKYAETLP